MRVQGGRATERPRVHHQETASREGDGFLYHMVRIMVGSLIEISEKRIEKDTLTAIIESRDREKAGRTAPACGLFLDYVSYGEAEV